MPDIASLGFKADVSELERANTTLDTLATNAAKAEKASKSMGDAIGKAGKSGGGGIKQTAADVEQLLDKLNPTSKAFDELDKSMRQLSSARGQGLINVEQYRDYTAIIERQRTAIQGTYDELTGYAQKQRETAAAEKQATQARQTDILSLNRLRAALDPAGEAARRMQEQFSLLAKARAGGLIDTKTYSDLTAKLNGLSKAAKEGGISAGQFQAGWAGATQQFIDLGVQLQGGANPLTALVQQGPQLAYSFGSVTNTLQAFRQQFSEVAKNFGFGAETIEDQAADVSDSVGDISESMNNTVDAAKNVGAGFARFINPTTVIITALVAGVAYLGYQAYKASVQMDTFQKAINSTGNIAGVSARQLSDLADQVDKNTDSGRGAAAEAVAIAASIGTSAAQIQKFSEAALNLSESTGESVEDILANFKRLAKDPVDALISLNEQYNFANTALYEQVKALSDAGDKAGAMQLVVSQLDASTKSLGETTEASINNSTGFWDNLAFSISNAWQNLKNYNAENAGGNYKGIGGGGGYDKPGYDPYGVQAQAKATVLSNKQVKDGVDGLLASLDKEAVKIKQFNRESIAANDEIDRLTKSQRTNAQIRNEETARYNKLRKEGLISEEKANAAIAAVNEKYKDPKGPKPKKEPAVKVDQGDKLTEQYQAQNLALDAQIRLLQNRNTNQANASTQRKDYLELEAKYSILQEAAQTRALTKQEQQMLASKDQVLAEAAITAQKGDQMASMQRQVQVSDELAKMTMDVQEQARIQSEYAGMSTREMEKQVELAKVRSAVLAKGGTGAQADQAEATKRAQQDLEEASRGDWIGASQTALADWADSATNYAAIARDSITKAMDTAASSVSDFLTTGKADFASFAKSILKMIADVISQLLVMQAIKAGASALGFDLTANAKGGVYQDPSLHSYVNGVYSSPQMFQFGGRSKFANGGVFAEAGPEAIMPLTRDGKGRLGVRSEGGNSGGIMITNHITVDAGGNTQASSTTSGDAMANALAKQMNDAAEGVLQKAVRPGGIVYNFTKGR